MDRISIHARILRQRSETHSRRGSYYCRRVNVECAVVVDAARSFVFAQRFVEAEHVKDAFFMTIS